MTLYVYSFSRLSHFFHANFWCVWLSPAKFYYFQSIILPSALICQFCIFRRFGPVWFFVRASILKVRNLFIPCSVILRTFKDTFYELPWILNMVKTLLQCSIHSHFLWMGFKHIKEYLQTVVSTFLGFLSGFQYGQFYLEMRNYSRIR